MYDLITRLEFWVAVLFALMIKLRTSKTIKFFEVLVSTVVAITAPLIFAQFVIEYLKIPESSKGVWVVVTLCALSGEHLARLALMTLDAVKPTDIIAIVMEKLGVQRK